MAEYLRVPYSTIMLAALVPALLFYLASGLQLDFTARKRGIPPLSEAGATPALGTLRIESALLAVGFVVLLGGIFFGNLPAERAAVAAAGVLAIAGLVLLARRGFTLRSLLRDIGDTGLAAADVVLVCALAGLIIGVLNQSGLGFTLSLVLLEVGRNSLFLLLVLTAIVSLVLGMGLPTTAVYLLLATLAAPTLVKLGVSPLGAHMFVFYYGLLSMITPPVALAAFAAASIAGASPVAVGWASVRMSWIAFLIPFLFVYQPGILMQGSTSEIAAAILAALIATPLVAGALVGHALSALSPISRLVWLSLGLALLLPLASWGAPAVTDAVLAIAGLGVLAAHVWRARAAGHLAGSADRA
jgi:TRAP transporter 4TM/12TM fusion protein